MPQILEQSLAIILPALATLLATWFGLLGMKLKKTYEEKINTQVKKEIVDATVRYTQQIFYTLDGPAKFQKALERVGEILSEKGIPFSDKEIQMLIEAAVYGLNQGLHNDNELTHNQLQLVEKMELTENKE